MKAGRWEELVAASPNPWKQVNSTTKIKELGWVRVWDDGPEPVRAVAVRRKERKKFYKGGDKSKKPRRELQYLIVGNVSRNRLGTRKLFKKYHQRQREEFSFKDGKQSLSTAKMPSMKLQANRMHVKMVGLAQLMLQLFAWKFLPHPGSYGPTCKTIREKVVVVGGKNQDGQPDSADANLLCVPMAQAHGSSGA
jgi:hypothetical protein